MSKTSKTSLKSLYEMTPVQELVYELLPVGDSPANLTRKELVDSLNMKDANARIVIKSLLPFAPVVATKGYFIAGTVDEVSDYIDTLKSKIKGLQRTIAYLEKHKKVLESKE